VPTKTIRVTVTEAKHSELETVKGDRTWREAICEEFGVNNE